MLLSMYMLKTISSLAFSNVDEEFINIEQSSIKVLMVNSQ